MGASFSVGFSVEFILYWKYFNAQRREFELSTHYKTSIFWALTAHHANTRQAHLPCPRKPHSPGY